MADVRMDVAAVRALAGKVLDRADLIDGIDWATIEPNSLTGSAVADAASAPQLLERWADLVEQMRTWAAAAQDSAGAIEAAQSRHARQLDDGR